MNKAPIDDITTAELDALPREQCAVMQSYAAYGTYEKVAADLNLPMGTVKSRIHRARAKIAAMRAATNQPETTYHGIH